MADLQSIPDFMDLDVPDLPEELLDVNNEFIDEYLKRVRDDNGGSKPSLLLPSFDLDEPLLEQPVTLRMGSESTSTGSHQSASNSAHANNPSEPSGQVPMPTAAADTAPAAATSVFAEPPAQNFPVAEEALEDFEEDDEPEPASKGKRGGAARKVTPQRKQNNRKAQQRYREKRKQQAAEREQQVAMLSSQLAAMQSIQNEHAAVSSENVQLREMLLQKEVEIENLKKSMAERMAQVVEAEAQPRAAQSANNKEQEAADEEEYEEDEDDISPREMPHRTPDRARMTHADATAKLNRLVQDMKDLMQAHDLPITHFARGEERYVASEFVSALRPLVIQADRMSMRRLLSAPTCPHERSMCDSKRFGAVHPCSVFRSHWTSILERVNFDESQVDILLNARKTALEQLRVIYEERAALNQMTMAIMLPAPTMEAMYDGTPDRKMKQIEQFGSKCALNQGQRLAEALDRIRQSLRGEQRIFAQLHEVIVLKVLSPAQSAVMFMLAGDNWLVEPLHITNLLALRRGLIRVPEYEIVQSQSNGAQDISHGEESKPEDSQHTHVNQPVHMLYTPSAAAAAPVPTTMLAADR